MKKKTKITIEGRTYEADEITTRTLGRAIPQSRASRDFTAIRAILESGIATGRVTEVISESTDPLTEAKSGKCYLVWKERATDTDPKQKWGVDELRSCDDDMSGKTIKTFPTKAAAVEFVKSKGGRVIHDKGETWDKPMDESVDPLTEALKPSSKKALDAIYNHIEILRTEWGDERGDGAMKVIEKSAKSLQSDTAMASVAKDIVGFIKMLKSPDAKKYDYRNKAINGIFDLVSDLVGGEGDAFFRSMYGESADPTVAGEGMHHNYNMVQVHPAYDEEKDKGWYITHTDAKGGSRVWGPFPTISDAKTKARKIAAENGARMMESVEEAAKKDPCWKGYRQLGMKMKGGKEVPNCVPVKKESVEESIEQMIAEDAYDDVKKIVRSLRGDGYDLEADTIEDWIDSLSDKAIARVDVAKVRKAISAADGRNSTEMASAMRSVLKTAVREEVEVNEYYRRSSSYSGDPRWITAKYNGIDSKGKPFKKGEEVLYFPNGKKFYTGAEAEKAWKDFLSAKGDEEGMPYAS